MSTSIQSKDFMSKSSAAECRYNVLDNVPLNAAQSERTYEVTLEKKYRKAIVSLIYTNGQATAVTFDFLKRYNSSVYVNDPIVDISSDPRATVTPYSLSVPSPSSFAYGIPIDVEGVESLKIIVGADNPSADDLISVQVTAIVGG